jgi:ABC-type transport system involved in cytochrome c biogenesis permease component
MSFLPIVGRELRVAARKRGTYWSRMGSAIAAIFIAACILMFSQLSSPQMIGKALFAWLGVVMLIFAAQAGIRVTSDCLSEEKREGTLGLLFLTDLKGYDVVFGKLVANSIGAFYGVLASFPVLAIALLLGGVTYGEFWRVAMVALNLLFLSLAIGMFSSAICRDERRAIGLAILLAILIGGLFPTIGAILAAKSRSDINEVFVLVSPVFSCVTAFDPMYKRAGEEFWISTIITHFYGWLLLGLACAIVPRSWQDKSASAGREKINATITAITQGTGVERRNFRSRLLDINPFYWRVAGDRMKPRIAWLCLLGMAAVWIWVWTEKGRDWLEPPVYVVTAIILHTFFKMQVAMESCRHMVDDRRSGAMELVLATPLRVEEILHGQRLGVLRQFGGPALVVLALDFIFLFACLVDERWTDLGAWLSLWIAGALIFIMDLNTFTWVGMWMGLTGQKTNRAAGAAVSRVLFIPWMAFGLTLSGIALLAFFASVRSFFNNIDWPGYILIIYWFALSVANNLLWIAWSKRKLLERFREIATQRFETPTSGFWIWLGRTAARLFK